MIISGKVKSIEGEPLMGVNIYPVKDGKPFEIGGITDFDGNFSLDLKNLPSDQPVKFSFVGFNPVIYESKELKDKTVIMTDAFEMLDTAIVTTPKKELSTLQKIENPSRIALIAALIFGTFIAGYVFYNYKKHG